MRKVGSLIDNRNSQKFTSLLAELKPVRRSSRFISKKKRTGLGYLAWWRLSILSLFSSQLLLLVSELAFAGDLVLQNKSSEKSGPTAYILSVGINDYDDEFWPDLKWAGRDAKKLSKRIGVSTGYHRKVILLNDSKATLKRIRRELSKIKRQARSQDVVFAYFSGHGTLALDKSGELNQVIVLRKTKKDRLLKTGLLQSELRRWAESLSARKKVLMFASCHSGVGKSRVPEKIRKILASSKGNFAPIESVSEGTLILAAASKGESARESDRFKGDVYTHYFIEALKVNDRNKDGQVSVLEAHDYAKELAYNYSKGRQRATVEAKVIGDGDFSIYGKKTEKGIPILEAYASEFTGIELEMEKGVKGKLPLAFPITKPNAKFSLYREGESVSFARYQISGNPTESINLEDILDGDPFRLGVGLSLMTWDSADMEKISSSSQFSEYYFTADFHHRKFTYGISHSASKSLESNYSLGALEGEFRHQASNFSVGYEFTLPRGLLIQSEVAVGYETMDISFQDLDLKLDYSADAFSIGVGGELIAPVNGELHLSMFGNKKWVSFEFDELGAVYGGRYDLGIGLQLHFGGAGSRI